MKIFTYKLKGYLKTRTGYQVGDKVYAFGDEHSKELMKTIAHNIENGHRYLSCSAETVFSVVEDVRVISDTEVKE